MKTAVSITGAWRDADSWLEEKSTQPLTWQVSVCRIMWMNILVGQFKAGVSRIIGDLSGGCSWFLCCGGKGCEQTEMPLGGASASRMCLQGREEHKVFAVSSVNLCREQTQGRSNRSRQGQLQVAETRAGRERELLPETQREWGLGTSLPSPAGHISSLEQAPLSPAAQKTPGQEPSPLWLDLRERRGACLLQRGTQPRG